MKKVKLLRVTEDPTKPQRGVLLVGGEPIIVTLELPWRDNEPKLSCIPTGVYTCKRDTNRKTTGGLRIPVTYEVAGVPNRNGILFHVGNTTKDTHGCIITGSSFGYISDEPAVLDSKLAFNKWLNIMDDVPTFELTVSTI